MTFVRFFAQWLFCVYCAIVVAAVAVGLFLLLFVLVDVGVAR